MSVCAEVIVQGTRRGRWRRWILGAATVLSAASVAIGFGAADSGNQPGQPLRATRLLAARPQFPTGPNYAYVTNLTGVFAVNLKLGSVAGPLLALRPGMTWGSGDLAVTPQGQTAYLGTAWGIRPLNLRTGRLGKAIPHTAKFEDFALDRQSHTLYLASTRPAGYKRLVAINVRTGAIAASIEIAGAPSVIAITPNGRVAYLLSGHDQLTPMNLSTDTVGSVISVPDGVGALAFSPHGQMAYAAGNTVTNVRGVTYSFITPIDLTSGQAEQPIRLRHQPYGIIVSSDGRTAYVTSAQAGPPVPPAITVINLITRRVTGTISVPGGADSIANAPVR